MSELFENPAAPANPGCGRVVGVAVAAAVWRSYDYRWPEALGEATVGQRVRVPFGRGNRTTLGFVTETDRPSGDRRLKTVAEIVDAESQLDGPLWELARWLAWYYLCPLGLVLPAMIPSAVGRKPPKSETVVYLNTERHEWPGNVGSRQMQILDELEEARKHGVEPLSRSELLKHSGAASESLKSLIRRELVRVEQRRVQLPQLAAEAEAADAFEPSDDQKKVLTDLSPKLDRAGEEGGFSATLLEGVTGSGKTEVYIRAIRRVLARGYQAIVLVPEISLATQTLQRLCKRLPRVAVLHSGLSEADRAFYFQQVRDGLASVVVGPRSAVFAPTRKLGLLIVDEEHEPSYKQDTAPRYHGRDVAIKRAALSNAAVLLGSATPSLESLHNARQGRYEFLRLPRRVRSLPMPRLQVVNLREEMTPQRIELLGRTLTAKIATVLDRGEQVILLMNRRGFASYVFAPGSGWILTCEHCDRPMVYHRASEMALCHHCGLTADVPDRDPVGGGKLVLFGYGIQRVSDELGRKFPAARVARMDSDTMTSPKQFQEVFEAFSAGEVDILLGTQMVAKGLDFPRVSLVGIASADTSLTVPDFRASERTFQLVVQVAGRAGRAEGTGEVVVQTLYPEEPAIARALEHDYTGFAATELPLREEAGLPPFRRLLRMIVRHGEALKAEESAATLAGWLNQWLPAGQTELLGPLPCGIARLRDHFRFHVLIYSEKPGQVQAILAPRMEGIDRELPAEVLADADPTNLM